MQRVLCGSLLLVCVACESPGSNGGAPPKPPAAREAPNVEEQVSRLEAASRPGPMHKKLEVLVGEWNTTVVGVAPNGTEVPGGSGTTHIKSLFEGRYLRWDAEMTISGRTQQTTGWLGYDRNAAEYQLCMITSFSSGMGIFRGQGDVATEGIVFVLEQMDSKTGVHMRARNRLKLVNHDHFVIEDEDDDKRVHTRSHYARVK